MIITFCGHSAFQTPLCFEKKVYSAIENAAMGEAAIFYLGGYGDFDRIAMHCCMKYKEEHPLSKLIFITPYLNEKYLKARPCFFEEFDEILYPELERVPPRYAILKRNQWMVENADFVIAYVINGWGGASKTLRHALKKGKPYVNLGGN